MNDTPSEALAGYMLSMHLFTLLEKKQVLTHDEALQAIDDILLNLETHQYRAVLSAKLPLQARAAF